MQKIKRTYSAIESAFHEKVSAKIRLVVDGVNRFRVSTPFRFQDGDHLVIVLKKEGKRWVFTDEAHTYMHLTYDIDEEDLRRGPRPKIVADSLSTFRIEDRNGELILDIPENHYADALYSFVQALLKISDVSYLSRQQIRSTFMEDFRALPSETAVGRRTTGSVSE